MSGPTSQQAPLLQLTGVTKAFGSQMALHPIDLDVHQGDFLALLGPSGCGKTTLLRLIGGFLQPDSGKVIIDGTDATSLQPERRQTNMVFQGYGLFPHMTVRENIAYGLRVARCPADKCMREVGAMLELMHISQFADRLPGALSGGQQQRVALARALIMKPRVLLLDEPLAALDLQLRKAMQTELRNLHRAIGGTFICVTHDQEEAIALANRIAVMNSGRIVQEGSPKDIYERPRDTFVAGFIGDSNIISLSRRSGACQLGENIIPSSGPDAQVAVMVRPSAVRVCEKRPEREISLSGQLVDAVFMGDYTKLVVATNAGETIVAHTARSECEANSHSIGKSVFVSWKRDDCQIVEQA